jgi:GNAT superfamily N-acetyltransferase
MTRAATSEDVDDIVATLTSAFAKDPLWAPPFAPPTRAEGLTIMWRALVSSAVSHGWVLITEAAAAASVWIPPGAVELSLEEEQRMHHLLVDHVGAASADRIGDILGQLDDAKPTEPCFFLSLLGTHSDHRGKGLGMSLLRDGLERIDALGAPAYLESSNPANNRRYTSLGFEVREVLHFPTGPVTTMWRGPRGLGAP